MGLKCQCRYNVGVRSACVVTPAAIFRETHTRKGYLHVHAVDTHTRPLSRVRVVHVCVPYGYKECVRLESGMLMLSKVASTSKLIFEYIMLHITTYFLQVWVSLEFSLRNKLTFIKSTKILRNICSMQVT